MCYALLAAVELATSTFSLMVMAVVGWVMEVS
jgi:hypothetical protein